MNYIGSKYSLLDFLTETIGAVAGDVTGLVFADLFAGTGVVGRTFKERGCRVIANDIQYYSYVLCRHLIENVPPLDLGDLPARLNALPGAEGFVYRSYCAGSGSGRNYYTDENGKKCDAIRMELERLHRSGEIDDDRYFYLLASLIQSIDKYANTASVYGAFLKHIKGAAARTMELELLPVVPGERGEAHNENISDLITRVSGDILYLDPPYNERQYAANYHVLETIARYDAPELHGKTGLRDYTGQRSDFCSAHTVEIAFDALVKDAQFHYIFLSYNNEGLMPLETIRRVMERYGHYDVFTRDYRRFKADTDENRSHKSDRTVEYLHCLEKNDVPLQGYPPPREATVFAPGTKGALFLELAQPDARGVSRWVDRSEFSGEYASLQFENGGSFFRGNSKLAKCYVVEKDCSLTPGSRIDRIRLAGYRESGGAVGIQSIRADIREALRGRRCVVLGTSKPEIDHKNGWKNDVRVMTPATQRLEDFQPLSKAANDAKRQFCKECRKTGKRFDARRLGYPVGWYAGGEAHVGDTDGCIGCFWYDPIEFRRHLKFEP